MIKKKRALVLDALARIVVMVIAVLLVFNIGKKIAESAGIGVSDIQEQFNKFVDEVNNLEVGDVNHVFVNLDMNTAIVGFSKNTDAYRCYSCGTPRDGLSTVFKKPNNEQCKNKACICLCRGLLTIDKTLGQPYTMQCDSMVCKTLKQDLAGYTELARYFENLEKIEPQKYDKLKQSKWEGGFFLERHSRNDFVSNALPSPQLRRFTVFLDKEQRGEAIFTTVCPGFDCPSKYLPDKQSGVPSDFCIEIKRCITTDMNMPRQLGNNQLLFELECKQNKASFYEENDCNTVKTCISSSLNTIGACNKAGVYYALTFTTQSTP